MNTTRRTVFKGMLAAGTLPLFNIGCAGFGTSRQRQLAKGAKTRIAIVGCGDWGRTLLNRAGLVGGCELVALCDPDPAAVGVMYAQCAKVWGRDALVAASVFADYREMFAKLADSLDAVFIATGICTLECSSLAILNVAESKNSIQQQSRTSKYEA